jgi:hypothetical protein
MAMLGASAARPIKELLVPELRLRRHAMRLARTEAAEARPGTLVKIVGRIERADGTLAAPLSKRCCAHYSARVEAKAPRGWKMIAEERQTKSFFVVDDTARVLVDTSSVSVDVVIDHLWDPKDADVETGFDLDGFLYQLGVSKPPEGSRVRLRYREGALEEGETVTVVGVAHLGEAGGIGRGYRDTGRRLTIGAPKGGRVFVSDGMHYV